MQHRRNMSPKSKREDVALSKSKRSSGPGKEHTNAAASPVWPALTPLPHPLDLSLHTVVPDQIFTISSFWPSTLCASYVRFLRTLNLITTAGHPKRGEAVRVNDRFQVNDHAFAERLWVGTGLKDLLVGENPTNQNKELWGGEPLGLNANIRIYRYGKGQFFDKHYDDSNTLLFPIAATNQQIPAKTTWTLLLYLTSLREGCEGGETVFYPEAKKKGEALCRSWRASKLACCCCTGMARLACFMKVARSGREKSGLLERTFVSECKRGIPLPSIRMVVQQHSGCCNGPFLSRILARMTAIGQKSA